MSAAFDFLPSAKNREATKFLPWVMAIMVYLSALAASGSLLLHTGFDDWASSLQGRVTVQVTGEDFEEIRSQAIEIQDMLRQTPGILSARVLEKEEIIELLEPWLGEGNVTEDLPVPVMIDLETAPDVYVNLEALEIKLKQITDTVYLDDHARWLVHFYNLTYTIEYTAIGILIMIILASIFIIIFGTKSSMSEHKSTIEIMHLMGAHDQMIAKAYQKRFMRYGLVGGVYGLILAFITLYGLSHLIQNLASGFVEVPTFPYVMMSTLLIFPIMFALLAMLTARITVMRELGRMI